MANPHGVISHTAEEVTAHVFRVFKFWYLLEDDGTKLLRKLGNSEYIPVDTALQLRRWPWFYDFKVSGCCYLERTVSLRDSVRQLAVLGVLAELREATISFVVFVHLSVSLSDRRPAWKNSVPTGRVFMKFRMTVFFERNNGYCPWRPIYIVDHLSLLSHCNEKYSRQTFR